MHLISQTLKIAHIIYSFTRPTLFPEIIKPTPSLWELTLHGQILSRHKYQTPQFPSLCHLHLSRSIALPWYGPAQGKETSTLVVIGSAAPNLTYLCVSGVPAQNVNQDLIEMLERHPPSLQHLRESLSKYTHTLELFMTHFWLWDATTIVGSVCLAWIVKYWAYMNKRWNG